MPIPGTEYYLEHVEQSQNVTVNGSVTRVKLPTDAPIAAVLVDVQTDITIATDDADALASQSPLQAISRCDIVWNQDTIISAEPRLLLEAARRIAGGVPAAVNSVLTIGVNRLNNWRIPIWTSLPAPFGVNLADVLIVPQLQDNLWLVVNWAGNIGQGVFNLGATTVLTVNFARVDVHVLKVADEAILGRPIGTPYVSQQTVTTAAANTDLEIEDFQPDGRIYPFWLIGTYDRDADLDEVADDTIITDLTLDINGTSRRPYSAMAWRTLLDWNAAVQNFGGAAVGYRALNFVHPILARSRDHGLYANPSQLRNARLHANVAAPTLTGVIRLLKWGYNRPVVRR